MEPQGSRRLLTSEFCHVQAAGGFGRQLTDSGPCTASNCFDHTSNNHVRYAPWLLKR
jgi:hypothetical protein